jgi:hypothetical protein
MCTLTKLEFEKVLEQIVGKICWKFFGGSGTGTFVELLMGERILDRSLLSEESSLDLQNLSFKEEYTIFIKCAWRIESSNGIICGCWEDNSANGSMLRGLQQLVGEKVESIKLFTPTLDLRISFNNGLTLHIFCDQTDLIENNDNYSLFTDSYVYIVGTRSTLAKEARHQK